MLQSHDHFERLFGELDLSPNDAARWMFAAGWNSAIRELVHRLDTMPIEADTRDSFIIYLNEMVANYPKETIAEHCQPKKREWQGLTEEQIGDIAALFYAKWRNHEGFARAIEAALKEKNHD